MIDELQKHLIIEKLTETSIENNGYVMIDDILSYVDVDFSMEEIDKLCEVLFSRGIIIQSETNDCELCDLGNYHNKRINYEYNIPIVVLTKKYILLNRVSIENLNTEKIELAFNYDTNMIRMMASNNGLSIKDTRLFSKGFFNYFRIKEQGMYIATFNQNDKALYVDLNKKLKR